MDIVHGFDNLKKEYNYPVITLGNFDGVHLGHREIFKQLIKTAKLNNGTSMIITFHPHPVHLLHPGRYLPTITDLPSKLKLFDEAGIDVVMVVDFTKEFSKLSPEDFILRVLVKNLKVRIIFIGDDFGFGKDRKGNRGMLERFGQENQFEIKVVKPIVVRERVVSSTLIRNLINDGRVSDIPSFLGRYYTVKSRVIGGSGRGSKLGCPTANLDVTGRFIPRDGVYVAGGIIGEKHVPGVAYIGIRPTFGEKTRVLELHLFNDPGNLYGSELEVRFIERLRSDIKFNSSDELMAQIRCDIAKARQYFLARTGGRKNTNQG